MCRGAGNEIQFQSAHPRGVRFHGLRCRVTASPCFNPRTRVGCDPALTLGASVSGQFQSAHPRGVRSAACGVSSLADNVSIRAPAWGAMRRMWEVLSGVKRFQSAHPRGVRSRSLGIDPSARNSFNPRTRVGCDDWKPWGIPVGKYVSIRAPAWGAIRHSVRLFRRPSCFNPRTRVGCDSKRRWARRRMRRFNPRTRVGCDSGARNPSPRNHFQGPIRETSSTIARHGIGIPCNSHLSNDLDELCVREPPRDSAAA